MKNIAEQSPPQPHEATSERPDFRKSDLLRPATGFCFALSLFVALILVLSTPKAGIAATADAPSYVGSPACATCHEAIHERFSRQSKKAATRVLVEKLQPKLSPEEQKTCFKCHATGYGQMGGFVSYSQTPDLDDVGCEACHGPGSMHVESKSPEHIRRKVPVEHCYSCHTPEHNRRRNFTPLPYGGAH